MSFDWRKTRHTNLYYLKMSPLMSCFATSTPKLMHDLLEKLSILVPSLKEIQVLDCKLCQIGKHVKSSFPKQTKKSNFDFSTAHSDI